MAKNSITDYSKTAASNTDIQSVDIAEGCLPSGINNAIRELMADLADMNDGTVTLTSPSFAALDVDNLKLDGNTLSSTDTNGDINIDPNGTGNVAVTSGKLTFGSVNRYVQNPSGTELRIGADNGSGVITSYTNGSESMRIDSSGRVGIGTTSPAIYGVDNADDLVIGQGDGNHGITISSYGTSNGTLAFSDQNNATVGRGFLDYDHNVNAMSFGTLSTERMRIDSSGRVGIGTSSPDSGTPLHVAESSVSLGANPTASAFLVERAGNVGMTLGTANTGLCSIFMGDTDSLTVGRVQYDNSGNSLQFWANSLERMRIDNSGNVLVGKTSAAGQSTSGIEVRGDGVLIATKAGTVQYLNRTGSDGEIARFSKDGTTVGSIGVANSDLFIDGLANHSGIRFQASSLLPRFNGAASDNAIDLGTSGNRFNDLYLGGGVYLGGTGSANHLDDYEEGTFTPVVTGVSGWSIRADGYYTKIGDIVHIFLDFATNTALTGTATNEITGLPFSNARNELSSNVSISRFYGVGFSASADYAAGVHSGSSITFRYIGGGNTANNFSFGGSTIRFTLSATYQTS